MILYQGTVCRAYIRAAPAFHTNVCTCRCHTVNTKCHTADNNCTGRRKLINELKRTKQMMSQMHPTDGLSDGEITPENAPEVPTGGGYSALQRKINETGTTEGLV